MNRAIRVLLVGRRFWPHGGYDAAASLMQIARQLQRRGLHIEVLTPRYAPAWPLRFRIGSIDVHRPAMAPRRDWSTGRYFRQTTAWLRQHGKAFDVVLVDAIREEAAAAIEASATAGYATVLRCGGWDDQRDTQWWKSSRAASRCQQLGKLAQAVIVPHTECQRELVIAGYRDELIHRIAPGFWSEPLPESKLKRAARLSLAEGNGDLMAEHDAPVLLCTSRMTRDSGIQLLVHTARHLVARFPNLRLWLIGDGPYRDWIYQQLRGDGVRASVAMPGSFCDTQDLFLGADAYLQPGDGGLDFFLPAAVSAALPVVALKTPAITAVLTTPETSRNPEATSHLRWVEHAKPKAVKEGIVDVLQNLDRARLNALSLRNDLLRHRPVDDMIQAYVNLIHRMTENISV